MCFGSKKKFFESLGKHINFFPEKPTENPLKKVLPIIKDTIQNVVEGENKYNFNFEEIKFELIITFNKIENGYDVKIQVIGDNKIKAYIEYEVLLIICLDDINPKN